MDERGGRGAAEAWLVRQGLPQALPAAVRRRRLTTRAAPLAVVLATLAIAWSILNRLAVLLTGALEGEGTHRLEELEQLPFTAPMVALAIAAPVVLIVGLVGAAALRRYASDRAAGAAWWVAAALLVVVPFLLDRGELRPWQLTRGLMTRALLALVVLGVVYVGGGAISRWALRRAVRELSALGPMVSRALPLLVLSMLFFFFNAEIWQVAGGIGWAKTWGTVAVFGLSTVAVFGLSTVVLVAVNLTDEVKDLFQLDATRDRFEVVLAGTPMDGWELPARRPALGLGERLNLILVPVTAQLFQIALFTTLAFVFFVAFGELTVPDSVAAQWMGRAPDPGTFLGFRTGISQQHLQVPLMLSGLAALSFAASSSAESAYRKVFLDPVIEALDQDLYARDAYVHRYRIGRR